MLDVLLTRTWDVPLVSTGDLSAELESAGFVDTELYRARFTAVIADQPRPG